MGREIYDRKNDYTTDANEDRDLVSVAKPIHEQRIKRYIRSIMHEVEARVFDPGYNEEGSKKRKERTYILDEKEAEER